MHPKPPCPQLSFDDPTRCEIAGWVRDHWDEVFRLLHRLGCSPHDAEDLTQETFLRAAQRRSSFVAGTNLRAWLMRIATNAFVDSQRRRKVAKVQPLPDFLELPDVGPHPSHGLGNVELAAALESALDSLPETAKMVVLLRTRADLSYREIAASLEMTEEVARGHMFRGRKRLMELLAPWL